MKKPVLFALSISLLASFTMLSATMIKLVILKDQTLNDTIHVFGVPISHIEQSTEGFSVEMLPGLVIVSAALGTITFALITARARLERPRRY